MPQRDYEKSLTALYQEVRDMQIAMKNRTLDIMDYRKRCEEITIEVNAIKENYKAMGIEMDFKNTSYLKANLEFKVQHS